MADDVLEYLRSKALSPRRASGTEVHLPCFFCGEDGNKRGRLYVNVDPLAEIPGLYMCHLCGAKGSLVSIKRWFGDATDVEEHQDDGYIRRAILETATVYYHENLADHEEVFAWLKTKRGLTVATIQNHQLGFAKGGLYAYLREQEFRVADILATGLAKEDRETHRIVDTLDCHLTIPYHVAGNVVMIRGRDLRKDAEKKYVTPFGQKARLFNSDVTWTAEQVVICEGELDALVLEQQGFDAVAVPGAQTWQESWTGYFSDVKRTYIVFDADDAGRKGAEKVSTVLPRARVVQMPELGTDITDFFVREGHTKEEFERVLRGSGAGLLVTVDEAWEEWSNLQGQEGLKLGYPEIDNLIKPGLLAAQVLIFLAKSGTGKTLTLLNLFQRMAMEKPDIKILFVSLEQTRGDWAERARRIYRFYNPGATDLEAREFWRERLLIIDRNRLTIDQLREAIDDFSYIMGDLPSVIAIDYLGYWGRAFKGEEYQRLSDAVMALKELGKETQRPFIVPHQVNRSVMYGAQTKADGARGSGVIEETGDFVFGLWTPDLLKDQEDKNGDLKCSIHKSRHGGTGIDVPLVLAPLSLVIADVANDGKYVKWARNEWHYMRQFKGITWEEAQLRHEANLSIDETNMARVRQAVHNRRQAQLV